MEKNKLLKIKDLSAQYGKNYILQGIDVSVDTGEIVALIGPNGAGKSTLLKAIFGLVPMAAGRIFWRGVSIIPEECSMVALGAAFVPQGRRVFPHLSVEENLEMGGFTLQNLREFKVRKEEAMDIFPVLRSKRNSKAGTLSGGEQQMLALARGLMTHPKLLLLDEPTLGLASDMAREVFAWIIDINRTCNTAFIIVEHNTATLFAVANKVLTIDKGRLVAIDNNSIQIHTGKHPE